MTIDRYVFLLFCTYQSASYYPPPGVVRGEYFPRMDVFLWHEVSLTLYLNLALERHNRLIIGSFRL